MYLYSQHYGSRSRRLKSTGYCYYSVLNNNNNNNKGMCRNGGAHLKSSRGSRIISSRPT